MGFVAEGTSQKYGHPCCWQCSITRACLTTHWYWKPYKEDLARTPKKDPHFMRVPHAPGLSGETLSRTRTRGFHEPSIVHLKPQLSKPLNTKLAKCSEHKELPKASSTPPTQLPGKEPKTETIRPLRGNPPPLIIMRHPLKIRNSLQYSTNT